MSTFAMHVAKTGKLQQIKCRLLLTPCRTLTQPVLKQTEPILSHQGFKSYGAGENTSENTSLASGLSVGTGTRLLNTTKLHSQEAL